MNKRQAKKKSRDHIFFGESYRSRRIRVREQHQRSFEHARQEHRNFWEEWKRGYPNRFPYKKWFESMVFKS